MGDSCRFDPCSQRCAECALFGDCLDEDLTVGFDTPEDTDAPLKIIKPWVENRWRYARERWSA